MASKPSSNRSNCLWIDSSKWDKAKLGVGGSLALIAAIVLVVSLFLIVAQQVHFLGIFHSFAQNMNVKWLSIALGVSSGLLLVDCLCLLKICSRLFKAKKQLQKHEPTDAAGSIRLLTQTPEEGIIESIDPDTVPIRYVITDGCYREEDACKLITPGLNAFIDIDRQSLEKANKRDFITYDIPIQDGTIFTLAFNEKLHLGLTHQGRVLHFISSEEREIFIKEMLPDYRDFGALKHACFGVPLGVNGDQGIAHQKHLQEILEPGSSYTFNLDIREKSYRVCIYKNSNHCLHGDFEMPAKDKLNDISESIDELDQDALDKTIHSQWFTETKTSVEATLKEPGDYWLAHDKSVEILFYRDAEGLHTRFFANGYGGLFILENEELLLNDIKDVEDIVDDEAV